MNEKVKMFWVVLFCCFLTACSSTKKIEQKNVVKNDAISIEERAENYYKNANLLLAEAEYRELLKLAPRYAKAWFRLGNIYLRSNQLDAAIMHYKKAIEFDSKLPKAWHNLALARIRQATKTLVEAKKEIDPSKTQEIDFLLKKIVEMQRKQ